MKKKYIICAFIFIMLSILCIQNQSHAADLDRITNYAVTVDPRMNDGSLDIIYEITWKVLDSTTEGPLDWVQIGTPNSEFDNPTALSKNIKSISAYNGSYVKIVFNKKYYAGEEVTFKYSIHQSYMYKISWGNCKYEYTPAWFTDIRVDKLTVKWNMDSVKKSDSKLEEDNYLVWNKTNMSKGEKLSVSVEYDKDAFSSLSSNKQQTSNSSYGMLTIFIAIIIISVILSMFGGGGGYYGHRGFYDGYGYRHYGGGCVRSSCACACAHSSCARSSCACACAGSGRAGCSKKDFYGTNITTKKLKNVIK